MYFCKYLEKRDGIIEFLYCRYFRWNIWSFLNEGIINLKAAPWHCFLFFPARSIFVYPNKSSTRVCSIVRKFKKVHLSYHVLNNSLSCSNGHLWIMNQNVINARVDFSQKWKNVGFLTSCLRQLALITYSIKEYKSLRHDILRAISLANL